MNIEKNYKKIQSIIEKNNFVLGKRIEKQDKDYYIEINNGTPAGEDWWETIWFDGSISNFAEKIRERADNFDIDEESEVYIEMRGKNGVPGSISEILEDAKWKKEKLKNLAELFEEETMFLDYESFIQAVDYSVWNNKDRFNLIVNEEKLGFGVYKDEKTDRYFYVEQSENDASDFFELELIASLDFTVKNDICNIKEVFGENILPKLFPNTVCCGEYENEDKISYLWFKKKGNF